MATFSHNQTTKLPQNINESDALDLWEDVLYDLETVDPLSEEAIQKAKAQVSVVFKALPADFAGKYAEKAKAFRATSPQDIRFKAALLEAIAG